MDLFTAYSRPVRKTRKGAHEDYDGFVKKFKPKKTTDDCYTPATVYDAVVEWVREHAPIEGREIVRPFWPGGDYENYDYPANCVVIDNPPFSIIAKIARFYQSKGIAFFLFAPQLTLFSAKGADWTQIVADAEITYENGAMVRTGFISSLFGDIRVMTAPGIGEVLMRLSKGPSKALPKYEYPTNLITASRLCRLAKYGYSIAISGKSLQRVSALDAQRASGRGVYGGGYLCSDTVAQEVMRAERAAAERAAAERAAAAATVWGISEREREIIESLG